MAKKKRRKRKSSKKKSFFRGKFWLLLIALAVAFYFLKDVQINYYDEVGGLKGAALKTAIHDRIRPHKILNFDQNISARYWWDNYFRKTDWHSGGYFWDMYSPEHRNSYLGGDAQAREHCMPRSWWGKRDKYSSYDANSDLHNLFPSDYKANSAKSNLPLGEVGISKFNNGVSKVGNNTYRGGYRGQVFEPADEYKGDFARVYFYMVTCYEDYAYNWREGATKTMIIKGTYPAFQPWAIDMLLKWHRQDPVSQKETNRNDQVYRIQGNRNPFVDYPDLAEYIWGDKVNETFESLNDNKSLKQPQLIDRIMSYIYILEYKLQDLKKYLK